MVSSSKNIPTNVFSNGESTSCDLNVETDNESVDGHACLAGSHEDNGGTGRALCMNSASKSLAFLNWNVDGLLSKLDDGEFIDYVSSFDLVCLVETFVDSFSSSAFPGHAVFCKPAYYNVSGIDNGVSALEECLVDTQLTFDDTYLLISGDLNARTGTENFQAFDISTLGDMHTKHDDPHTLPRCSEDKVIS
ncbi:hypothetical protein BaRGS_00018001, partial [Batillaria attramentaria]